MLAQARHARPLLGWTPAPASRPNASLRLASEAAPTMFAGDKSAALYGSANAYNQMRGHAADGGQRDAYAAMHGAGSFNIHASRNGLMSPPAPVPWKPQSGAAKEGVAAQKSNGKRFVDTSSTRVLRWDPPGTAGTRRLGSSVG